jgi:hypothetical protein
MSIRNAASACHVLHVRSGPRGARTRRGEPTLNEGVVGEGRAGRRDPAGRRE